MEEDEEAEDEEDGLPTSIHPPFSSFSADYARSIAMAEEGDSPSTPLLPDTRSVTSSSSAPSAPSALTAALTSTRTPSPHSAIAAASPPSRGPQEPPAAVIMEEDGDDEAQSPSPHSITLSPPQRVLLTHQLTRHIHLLLHSRGAGVTAGRSQGRKSEGAQVYKKAMEMLSALCALRVAHQHMFRGESVLQLPSLEECQEVMARDARLPPVFDEPPVAAVATPVASTVITAQRPTVVAAVTARVSEAVQAREVTGPVTAATVATGASSTSPTGVTPTAALPYRGVVNPATVIGGGGSHTVVATVSASPAQVMAVATPPSSTPAVVSARMVVPAQRAVNPAVMAREATSTAHLASPAPVSALSSSLALTRSPTPLMANLSLYSSPAAVTVATKTQPAMATAAPPITATVVSPPLASPLSATSLPSPPSHLGVTGSPLAASPARRLTQSPSPEAACPSPTLSESSLDSFASLALASLSASHADVALSALATLASSKESYEGGQSSQSHLHPTYSSRQSAYRRSEHPNKRSRSFSSNEVGGEDVPSPSSGKAGTLRKNRSQHALDAMDGTTVSPSHRQGNGKVGLSGSSSFSSLSSLASPAVALPASSSFPMAASGSGVSPRRRLQPSSVHVPQYEGGGSVAGEAEVGLLSPSTMRVVTALFSPDRAEREEKVREQRLPER